MIRSTFIGIVASAILLVVLGVSRLIVVSVDLPDVEIREIETVTYEPPPPPPPIDEPPPESMMPPPALTSLSPLPDPSRVAIPQAEVPMDIRTPVENFFTDLAPAALPERGVPAARPSAPRPATLRPATPRPTPPPPVAKSHYQASELDGTPRLIRHGSAPFPTALSRQGIHRGTVTLEVELSTSGAVSVRRIISATHPDLVPAARRIASGSRYTAPRRNGQAVKAIMQLPITIQK